MDYIKKRSNTFTIKSQAIPPPPPGCPPPNQRYFLASHHDLETRNQNNNDITSSPIRKKQCQRVHSANASLPARIHSSASQAHSASVNLPTKNVYQIIAKTISTQTLPVNEHKSVNTDDQIDSIPEFMTPSFGPQRSGE